MFQIILIMNRLFGLFVLLVFSFASFTQDEYADSLLHEVEVSSSDAEKIILLNSVADYLVWMIPDSAIKYAEQAYSMAITSNEPIEQVYALTTISAGYYILGNTDIALENGRLSLDIARQSEDNSAIAASANNLGLIYQDLENFEASIDYFKEAIANSGEEAIPLHSIINNMANSYYYLEDFEKSMQYHDEALKIRREINDISGIADCLNDIGLVHWKLGEKDLAISNIKRCIAIKDSIGDHEGIAFSSLDLSGIYDELNDYQNLKKYASIGLEAAEQIGSNRYKKYAYEMLSKSAYNLGDYKRAYELHVSYSEVKDSVLNEESLRNISALEAKYENQKKIAAIEKLQQEKKLEEQENEKKEALIERDRIIKIALYSGLGLFVLLLVSLLIGLRQKKRDNALISNQNSTLESQKKEIRAQHVQLEAHFDEIKDSISYAKRIQNAILPPLDYFHRIVPNSFILYKPKDIVAGDFYWLEEADDYVVFAAADCTGHGVPGAMVSVVCHNALNRAVREFGYRKPSDILDQTRSLVIETFEKSTEEVKDGMDIAICVLNKNTNKLEFASANNRLYHIRNGELTDVKGDKQPIGKYTDAQPFTQEEIEIEEGDQIYIFSDGYPDQFGGPNNKKLKYKAFKQLLLDSVGMAPAQQHDFLNQSFETWKGDLEQVDDVCVIGVRF